MTRQQQTEDGGGAEPRRVGDESVAEGIVIESPEGGLTLAASRCPLCGDLRYPPRRLCPNDLTPMERIPLPRDGVIYEAVEVERPPVGFDGPYWLAYVDVGGVRVFARVASSEDPRHGTPVELSFETIRTDPEPLTGPVFLPKSES